MVYTVFLYNAKEDVATESVGDFNSRKKAMEEAIRLRKEEKLPAFYMRKHEYKQFITGKAKQK